MQPDGPGVEEVVADKGYDSDETLIARRKEGQARVHDRFVVRRAKAPFLTGRNRSLIGLNVHVHGYVATPQA